MKLFHDIDTNDLKDIIDEFIIKVNPDKLPVNKKKKLDKIKVKIKKKIKKMKKNNKYIFYLMNDNSIH